MTSKKHRMIVYGVAAQLLLIALVCYAAFPVKAPDEPVRLMYQTQAGKVLFDHNTHSGDIGYGLSCFDCHHYHGYDSPEEMPDDNNDGKPDIQSCSVCHVAEPEEGVHPEYCMECHDESDLEDSEYPKHTDALHQQCWKCHEEYEKGPSSSSDDCGKCHVL